MVVGIVDVAFTSFLLKVTLGISVLKFYENWIINIPVLVVCSLTTFVINYFIDFQESSPYLVVFVIAIFMLPVWYIVLRLSHHPLVDALNLGSFPSKVRNLFLGP